MPEITIRLLEPGDDRAYQEIFLKALRVDEQFFRIAEEDLTIATPATSTSDTEPQATPAMSLPTAFLPDSFSVGAFDGTKLVGIVSFERDGAQRIRARHKGRLFRMYVDDAYRGKGIGHRLINRLLESARLLPNLKRIGLTVMAHNQVALRLYQSFGFVSYGVEPDAVYANGEYRDEAMMSLLL